ncbi:MAG: DUF366 family protein [Candidatus Gastranaerophilales bacterium]|nr:DUF366 family protein [Candidatus Gastranaerophilales bacterium]
MEKLFIDKEIKYIGSQLSPHWIYKNFNLQGDAIVSFIGEVDVKLDEMVDIEDVINNEPIYSKKMLNFIIEIFNCPLEQMVWTQRLFMSIIKEELEGYGISLKRDGDDLFYDNRKLSVSIATKSITSCLIHSALNIIKEGAPISVSDLTEMGIKDVEKFALDVMQKFQQEVKSIRMATYKVRGVIE